MYAENCGFIDSQAQLKDALFNQDIRLFVAALHSGADANLREWSSFHGVFTSIYQMALYTPGCRDFIKACIEHGNKGEPIDVRLTWEAARFAAESRDPENLKAILKHNVDVNKMYKKLTPLNSLAKNLSEENASAVLSCMKLLLDKGASPNIPDEREFTPLQNVLRKRMARAQKEELVKLFLSQPELDIDSYRNGEVRRLLQTQFPELTLPEVRQRLDIDEKRLLRTLTGGDEVLFEQQFAEYLQSHRVMAINDLNDLLTESIELGMQRALEAILSSGLERGNETDLVKYAIVKGNWEALGRMLDDPNLHIAPNCQCICMNSAIDFIAWTFNDLKYQRCFTLLLNSNRFDINEADVNSDVPLSYASKSSSMWAMKKLLEHGAYIGSKNPSGTLAIKDISPEVLKEHFDSCITTNGKDHSDLDFEVIIDYKNLIPDPTQVSSTSGFSKQLQIEMAPFALMAETKEMEHLLQHPLISSFLCLKWRRLSMIFHLDLLLYFLFSFFLITYSLLKLHAIDDTFLVLFWRVSSWVGIIIRGVFRFFVVPIQKLKSTTKIVEGAHIILSIYTCMEFDSDKETQRVLATLNILLVFMVFCVLVGSQPVLSIATHMFKLREVLSSFLKSFSFYSIFLLATSLCSYIIFGNSTPDSGVAKDQNEGINVSNPICLLINTIFKKITVSNITFTSTNHYLIFLIFVLFMTIVIYNLLHHLVANNTPEIMALADLKGSISRTLLMSRYEQVLTTGFFKSNHVLQAICQRWVGIGRDPISILPNDGNKVLRPQPNTFEMWTSKDNQFSSHNLKSADLREREPSTILPCCWPVPSGNCSQMDDRTVKLALAVIVENNRMAQQRKQEEIEKRQQSDQEEIEEKNKRKIEERKKDEQSKHEEVRKEQQRKQEEINKEQQRKQEEIKEEQQSMLKEIKEWQMRRREDMNDSRLKLIETMLEELVRLLKERIDGGS
uniref:Transient receptor potential cation channel protein painless-like n=1 Tax=Drosophila rhopaloa TaxID=1041015 RepID=A0A6P4E4U5_DRORH